MADIRIRVYYEDTDSTGVVYHAGYLRYFERARSEWLRNLGFSHQVLSATFGIAFTVSRLSIDYLRPARLDDVLIASAEIEQCRRASFCFEQNLQREGESQRLARAQVRIACVDMETFRPCRLPEPLYRQLI